MPEPVGVLALQGDFEVHGRVFARLGVSVRPVRRPHELAGCTALVIPGGESTTLARLIDRGGLRQPLHDFASTHPVMGTCAGLIMLARQLAPEPGGNHGVVPLGLLDCTVQRNGYGRQIDSFSEALALSTLNGSAVPFRGVFIRAPRILSVGSAVEVIASRGDEPVAVRQGYLLGLAFHPELAHDDRVHAAFLSMVVSS